MVIPVVHCGDQTVKLAFEQKLHGEGVRLQDGAELQFLIDQPLGWATMNHDIRYSRCIVLSDNLCPTYRLDILERKPAALIALDASLKAAIETVQAGNVSYPRVTSPLTPAERRTLRFTAQGRTNKEISSLRGVSEKTVKNSLYSVFKKLKLKSRVQASHYYYGHWHLLENKGD